MNRLVLADSDTDIVKLADRFYKKQILRTGRWLHGDAKNGELVITQNDLNEMVRNYREKTIENLPIYRGHASSKEVEQNPKLYAGDVVDLVVEGDALYALMDIEDSIVADLGKVYKNVSAAIDESYIDKEEKKAKGKVLRHIALVQEPYVKKLDPAFIPLSEDTDKEIIQFNLSEEKMDEEKKVDVVETVNEAVETKTETEATEVETVSTEEVTVNDEKKEEEKTEETVETESVEEKKEETTEKEESVEEKKETELSEIEILKEKLALLEEKDKANRLELAESQFNTLLGSGKIVPAQKEIFLSLYNNESTVLLSDGAESDVSSLFMQFIEKMPVVVDLSEKGVNTNGQGLPELTEEEKESFKFMKYTKEQIEEYKKRQEADKPAIS